jgi:aspartate-semialdehyde dehydrogenase
VQQPILAIVGGESLLGQEVRDVAAELNLRAELPLISSTETGLGVLTVQEDEAAFVGPLEEGRLKDCDLAFLAGSPASSRKTLEILSKMKPVPPLVDLTAELEDVPEARLRAPMVEPEGFRAPDSLIQVIAHPAAISLALFFSRLSRKHPIRRSTVQVFEPVSERGKAGIEELQQQTVSLLALKTLKKDIFDTQVSFNLLPGYGEEAKEDLAKIEARLDRHLASLLALESRVPMPSVRLAHAPVFHGHTFSIWVEFEENPGPEAAAQALASVDVDIRGREHEFPSNVGVAGQRGITVGAIEQDRNEARACWFWMVSDNLRIAAENALKVARALLPETGEESA